MTVQCARGRERHTEGPVLASSPQIHRDLLLFAAEMSHSCDNSPQNWLGQPHHTKQPHKRDLVDATQLLGKASL